MEKYIKSLNKKQLPLVEDSLTNIRMNLTETFDLIKDSMLRDLEKQIKTSVINNLCNSETDDDKYGLLSFNDFDELLESHKNKINTFMFNGRGSINPVKNFSFPGFDLDMLTGRGIIHYFVYYVEDDKGFYKTKYSGYYAGESNLYLTGIYFFTNMGEIIFIKHEIIDINTGSYHNKTFDLKLIDIAIDSKVKLNKIMIDIVKSMPNKFYGTCSNTNYEEMIYNPKNIFMKITELSNKYWANPLYGSHFQGVEKINNELDCKSRNLELANFEIKTLQTENKRLKEKLKELEKYKTLIEMVKESGI